MTYSASSGTVTGASSNPAEDQTIGTTDNAPPTILSIGTASTTTINLTLSEEITVNSADSGDFVLSGDITTTPTVNAITANGATVTLSLSDSLDGDDVISLAYTQNTGSIDDTASPSPNSLASFAAVIVANNIAPTDTPAPLVNPTVRLSLFSPIAAELAFTINDLTSPESSISDSVSHLGVDADGIGTQFSDEIQLVAGHQYSVDVSYSDAAKPLREESAIRCTIDGVTVVMPVTLESGNDLRCIYTLVIEDPPRKSGGGSSNDWKTKPTFGKSYENANAQIVEGGFSFNGITLDITDNWHTDFNKTSSIIGESNHVELKVYTAKKLRSATLQLGIPDIGESRNAETGIHVLFQRNYTNPNNYEITEIIHEQNEPLINENNTSVSIIPSKCTSDSTNEVCHTISFDFTIMAPLKHEVVAIKASDYDRRSTTTFINEGVEFTGDSLLAPQVHTLMQKTSAQERHTVLELTQIDRRYAVYEDQFGYTWTKNSYGSWSYVTGPVNDNTSACSDINDRVCDAFGDKLDWHTGNMENLRDSMYGDIYQIEEFDDLEDAISLYDMDGDSREKFLSENGMMWIRD